MPSVTIAGTPITPSVTADPLLCTVSGNILNILGQPFAGVSMDIRNIYNPVSSGTATLLLRERQTIRSDSSGQISFNLIRGARVRIELPNQPELEFEVTVPDQASIDLVDLLLPYVVSVAFDDASPLAVEAGTTFSILTTGTLSNGQTVDTSPGATLESSNEAILLRQSTTVFRAIVPGTVTVSITDLDDTLLGINLDPSGDPIPRAAVPATTFPTALTVNVS